MELMKFEKVRDGKYLKNYELTYRNKAGREKKYEMVSRRELAGIEDVGGKPSGVSIVATYGDRMLLLHEFRMGVNRTIYNLCAGMLEPGESIEECVARELYEETGLQPSPFPIQPPTSPLWRPKAILRTTLRKTNRLKPGSIPRKKSNGCWKRKASARGHRWRLISLRRGKWGAVSNYSQKDSLTNSSG